MALVPLAQQRRMGTYQPQNYQYDGQDAFPWAPPTQAQPGQDTNTTTPGYTPSIPSWLQSWGNQIQFPSMYGSIMNWQRPYNSWGYGGGLGRMFGSSMFGGGMPFGMPGANYGYGYGMPQMQGSYGQPQMGGGMPVGEYTDSDAGGNRLHRQQGPVGSMYGQAFDKQGMGRLNNFDWSQFRNTPAWNWGM